MNRVDVIESAYVDGKLRMIFRTSHYRSIIMTIESISDNCSRWSTCFLCERYTHCRGINTITSIISHNTSVVRICANCVSMYSRIRKAHHNPNWLSRGIGNPIDYAFLGGNYIHKSNVIAARYRVGLYLPIMRDVRAIILRFYIELFLR